MKGRHWKGIRQEESYGDDSILALQNFKKKKLLDWAVHSRSNHTANMLSIISVSWEVGRP